MEPPKSQITAAMEALSGHLQTQTGFQWNAGVGDRAQPGKTIGIVNVYQTQGAGDRIAEFQREIGLLTLGISLTANSHFEARGKAWDWIYEIARIMKVVSVNGISGTEGSNLVLKGIRESSEGRLVNTEKYSDTQNSNFIEGIGTLFYQFPLETQTLDVWQLQV